MEVLYNPNNALTGINDLPAATGGLFRQPSNTRKSFSEGPARPGSGSTAGSTAEFTGVRHSFSSNGTNGGGSRLSFSSNNGGGSRPSFSSTASLNNGGGSRPSFSSTASSNNGGGSRASLLSTAPAPIEFPNTEHSSSGSVASYEVPRFRKPATFSRPLSAVQPVASSLPLRSATAGPVPVQGSARGLPSVLPSPSRTKLRSPTLAKPKSSRVMNAGGTGSVEVVNWMTGKKTPTIATTFRRNTRYRKNSSRKHTSRSRKKNSRE